MEDSPGVQVTEGTTTFRVPASGHAKGPKARGTGFYNPAMRLARDLSVAVAAVVSNGRPRFSFLDGLAATGARGLRVAHEVPAASVTLNDVNEAVTPWLERNVAELGLANATVRTGLFEAAVAADGYDWVDVDPYGTPAPFLDAAVRGVRHKGVVAVTATDTATLCGVYPDACRRRYDARPLHGPFMRETGMRILVGALVRTAARHDRAAEPVYAHATDHYLRAYVRVLDGARRADAQLALMGYAWFDGRDRGVAAKRPADASWAGPLWAGHLWDSQLAATVRDEVAARDMPRDTARLATRVAGEAEAPALYTTLAELGRATKAHTLRVDDVVTVLRSAGHRASRTHFDPAAVKTDASWDVLSRACQVAPA